MFIYVIVEHLLLNLFSITIMSKITNGLYLKIVISFVGICYWISDSFFSPKKLDYDICMAKRDSVTRFLPLNLPLI